MLRVPLNHFHMMTETISETCGSVLKERSHIDTTCLKFPQAERQQVGYLRCKEKLSCGYCKQIYLVGRVASLSWFQRSVDLLQQIPTLTWNATIVLPSTLQTHHSLSGWMGKSVPMVFPFLGFLISFLFQPVHLLKQPWTLIIWKLRHITIDTRHTSTIGFL